MKTEEPCCVSSALPKRDDLFTLSNIYARKASVMEIMLEDVQKDPEKQAIILAKGGEVSLDNTLQAMCDSVRLDRKIQRAFLMVARERDDDLKDQHLTGRAAAAENRVRETIAREPELCSMEIIERFRKTGLVGF